MYYITISNGLLRDGHRKRMGSAVWEFMWLIDKVTRIEANGSGVVLGGKPVKLEEIAEALEVHAVTVSENLSKLEEEGYIKKTVAPYGLVLRVMKMKKRFNQKAKPAPAGEEMAKPRKEKAKPNKTIAVDKTVDTAAVAAAVQRFNMQETKAKWYAGTDVTFQLLAWFFDRKGLWPRLDSRAKVNAAVQRHIRAARTIVRAEWTQAECSRALAKMLEANPRMRDEWTLETLVKYLTK